MTEPARETIVRLDQVSKRFGSQVALDHLSLEIPSGRVFALLGENGAGKTTAIKILLGLVRPDQGAAEVLGMDSQQHGLWIRQQVGYVAEQPALYEWMKVAEIGWFAAGFYRHDFLPLYQQRIQQFGVPLNQPIKSLSKGMRSKVSLALALATNPRVLVLDEPTAGLDALVRREFLESMVDLAAEGRTVFLSSHQINEVERVADMVAMIREGKLMCVDELDTLKAATREVVITMETANHPPVHLPWPVLDQFHKGRQWQFVVRDWDASQLADVERGAGVVAAETRQPTLEEIFVAVMKSSQTGSEWPSRAEASRP